MSDEFTIVDSEINIDEYIRLTHRETSIKEKLDINDFVILPHKYSEDQYYYAQESLDFLKFCKCSDIESKIDILDNGDIEVRSLHSFDIWLPVIWVAENILFPAAISLVMNYVYDKLKGRENEKPVIDVTYEVKDGKKAKTLHFKGDLQGFKDKFEKIDISKL